MPIESPTLPQATEPIFTVSLTELVAALPISIPFPIKIWIGADMGRYGRTANNLIFITDDQREPSVELREFFNNICVPLRCQAVVMTNWKDRVWTERKAGLIPLYNNGRLVINKDTMAYTEIPMPTVEAPVITVEEVKLKLPRTIQWIDTIWLTGSLVRKGWSSNDVDMIIFMDPPVDKVKLREVRNFFTDLLGWRTDVGYKVMVEREPVYLYKIYSNGELCPL